MVQVANTPSATPPGEGDDVFSTRIRRFLNGPVSELAKPLAPEIGPEEIERKTLYALLTLALVRRFYNGNKRGSRGNYPRRDSQVSAFQAKNSTVHDRHYDGGDYLGHNIAAIAVAKDGSILDFDFNNVELFNSSLEHAEARLVRRLFDVAQKAGYRWKPALGDVEAAPGQSRDGGLPTQAATKEATDAVFPRDAPSFTPPPRATYFKALDGITIYASLEPCAQCAGIMALAGIPTIVYLQYDPEQHYLCNILRRLGEVEGQDGKATKYLSPLPIDAAVDLKFKHSQGLNDSYRQYAKEVNEATGQSFWLHPKFQEDPANRDYRDPSSSVASFLCTDNALRIFDAARTELGTKILEYPEYKPVYGEAGPPPEQVLSNADVLEHVRDFLQQRTSRERGGARPVPAASKYAV